MTKGKTPTSPADIALDAKERQIRGLITDLNRAVAEAREVFAEVRKLVEGLGKDIAQQYHEVCQRTADDKLEKFAKSLQLAHDEQMAGIAKTIQEFRDDVIPATGVTDQLTLVKSFAEFLGFTLHVSQMEAPPDQQTSVAPDLTHLMQKVAYQQMNKRGPRGRRG